MSLGAMLQSVIYLVSASMLYPAMFLLVAGFLIAVASCGAAVAEWAERRREKTGEFRGRGSAALMEELEGILKEPGTGWDDIESYWRAARLAGWKKLDYLRILARLGPAMGLVGTLIPMSTGLASLSQGDTSRLSSDLVVAFSTTVVGLSSGVAAYILYIIRARWLESDLEGLRSAIESAAAKIPGDNAGEREP